MCQSNSSHLLELLHFEHSGQEAPGGGPDDNGVVWGLVQQQRGVGDGNSVDSKFGYSPAADGSHGEASSNGDLESSLESSEEFSFLNLTETWIGFLVAGLMRARFEASNISRALRFLKIIIYILKRLSEMQLEN